jgi:multidrug efflux pump subunit AcrB
MADVADALKDIGGRGGAPGDIAALRDITVMAEDGKPVPLAAVADIRETSAPSRLWRVNGHPAIPALLVPAPGVSRHEASAALEAALARMPKPGLKLEDPDNPRP